MVWISETCRPSSGLRLLVQLSLFTHLPRIEVAQAEFGAKQMLIRFTRGTLNTNVQVPLLMQLVDRTAGVFELDGPVRRVEVEDIDLVRCEGARGRFYRLAQLLGRVVPGLGGEASKRVFFSPGLTG